MKLLDCLVNAASKLKVKADINQELYVRKRPCDHNDLLQLVIPKGSYANPVLADTAIGNDNVHWSSGKRNGKRKRLKASTLNRSQLIL